MLEVVVRLGDTVLDVAYVEGGYTHAGEPLALAHGARVQRGLVEIAARTVERPVRDVPLTPHGDRRALTYIAASLAVHLVVWAVVPPPPEPPEPKITLELHPPGLRRAHIIPEPSRSDPEHGTSPSWMTTGGGSPTRGDAGAAGGKSTKPRGHIQIAKRAEQPAIARPSGSEHGRPAYRGILASQEVSRGFDAIVGTADLSSGFDKTDIYAPLYGGTGEGGGTFGLARDGTGDGAGCGGGECAGIIGVGRYGTLSNDGEKTGHGWGGGRGGMRGRQAAVPTVIMCNARMCAVVGALDKAIIRRYIRRELAKVTYCYERELLAKPGLAGTVSTDFLIAPDGHVVESTATGVGDAVAACVAGVMKNIVFPPASKYDRSGSTRVTYPFTFHPAGA